MRIPHTVPANVFEAYRCSEETLGLSNERERRIRAEDAFWAEGRLPSLRILALRAIAFSWKDNPIALHVLPTCEDRAELIELLPTDLPFELIIEKIEDEYYWERCLKDRQILTINLSQNGITVDSRDVKQQFPKKSMWPSIDPADHGDSWRQGYCECLIAEYLESLEPSYIESQMENCERMTGLVRDYVQRISLRSLLPTKKQRKLLDDNDPCAAEGDVVHHIPMNVILPQLPNLVEIRLAFGLIYMNDGFQWRDFQFSVEDCMGLGQGIQACGMLKRFVLSRSNLDQLRVAALLQGMVKNENIEEVDFSHCKLGDKGAYAVGEFLSMHNTLKTLHLINNNIGPRGAAGISCGLLKRKEGVLKHLDLRLNPLLDAGICHICAYLIRSDSLEVLNISGCGVTSIGGAALAEVLGSDCVKSETLVLDVSNNDFGEEVGREFEAALKSAPFVAGCDARMCNFSEQSEHSIYESTLRNRQERKKESKMRMLDRVNSEQKLVATS